MSRVIFYTAPDHMPDLVFEPRVNCGIDLYPLPVTIPVKHPVRPMVVAVQTPYRFAFPSGVHGIIHGRSGNFFHRHVSVFHGVIDSSYRGPVNIGLLLFDPDGIVTDGAITFSNSIAIAQLVIVNYTNVPTVDLRLERISEKTFSDLPPTTRGVAGFGSTGIIGVDSTVGRNEL